MMLLTNAARRFRELELSYLQNLRDADDSVEALIHLWTTERDEIAAHALLSWQSGRYECSDGLVAEQVALTTVCRTHPGWADPWARLATLHYYQGRMEEALSAAEHAASVKPWHFEALNVGALVLSWARREADSTATSSSLSSGTSLDRSANNHNALATRAAGLARHVLPPLTPQDGNQARHMWVDRAVALASSQLQCAEEANEAARAEWLVHQGKKSTSTHNTSSSTTEIGHKSQSTTPSPMSQQQHVSAARAAAAFQAKFMLNDSEIWQ
jgi:tetratricopeptide (TPR) repeat protein